MPQLALHAEDGHGAPGPATGASAVLLCSDVAQRSRHPLTPEMVTAALGHDRAGAHVVTVPALCSWASELAATVRSLRAERVVVGCAQGADQRHRILSAVRGGGAHPGAVRVVDLAVDRRAGAAQVAAQAHARLRSALAGVSHADLSAPVGEGTARLSSRRVSRRGLFSLGYLAPRPVAGWAAGRCRGQGPWRPCALACPHDALSLRGARITISEAACTGCGACVSACPSGAMSLHGLCLAALEAAAATLVEDACRLGLGVAIVCSDAVERVELGGAWLPLEVPSLTMVSAGWPLQAVAAGAAVKMTGCAETACAGRGRELARFVAAVAEEVASRPGKATAPAGPAGPVRLREPEATVAALLALGAQPAPAPGTASGTAPGARPWQVVSPVAPLGQISVDAALCSGCGSCLPVCPTGALGAPDGPAAPGAITFGALSFGALSFGALSFDPAACCACGACVASCPEGAVSLGRVVGSASLTAGRHPLVEVPRPEVCTSCGQPLVGGALASTVAARLAASHPEVASRLRVGERCADCLLSRG